MLCLHASAAPPASVQRAARARRRGSGVASALRVRAATAAQEADAAPPPYTTLSVPVFSMSTAAATPGGRATMNIITYAAPITIKPRRRYSVALYHGTQTLENMRATGRGVLQILGAQHAALVPLLGKTRGQDVDKLAQLQSAHGVQLQERFGVQTIADCAGAFELTVAESHDAGDHVLLICDVGASTPAALACVPLTTGALRAQGLL